MSVTTALRALGPIDLRMIRRDSFQVSMVVLIFGLGLLMRFGVPWLTGWLAANYSFDLSPYHPLLASYMLCLFPPMIVGQVIGFLLLDEEDSGIAAALRVTPLSATAYLLYRLAIPMGISAVLTAILVPIVDLPFPSPPRLLALALIAGFEAPIFALLLASIARNKVEGFAAAKGMSSIQILPIAAMFLPLPWQWAAGWLPNYWLVRAFWVASPLTFETPTIGFWTLAALALLTHLIALVWFIRRFARRRGRVSL